MLFSHLGIKRTRGAREDVRHCARLPEDAWRRQRRRTGQRDQAGEPDLVRANEESPWMGTKVIEERRHRFDHGAGAGSRRRLLPKGGVHVTEVAVGATLARV